MRTEKREVSSYRSRLAQGLADAHEEYLAAMNKYEAAEGGLEILDAVLRLDTATKSLRGATVKMVVYVCDGSLGETASGPGTSSKP